MKSKNISTSKIKKVAVINSGGGISMVPEKEAQGIKKVIELKGVIRMDGVVIL